MQSIEQIVEQHEILVKRVVYKLNLYQNVEDYLQIGRIALWECVGDYDESLGEFEMFAYMRIKYAIIHALKQAKKYEQFEVVMEQDKIQFQLDQQEESGKEERYPDWFALLNDEERIYLKMIYYEGKTTEEVANLFGYSYEAMKKRRQRLMKKLKQLVPKEALH
ncbi:hypothetical protein DCE79_06590 [Lysinibacillus sp. 2017]|uniref:sigma-70 family RNA polymerase sigma factor n=1 Tax=unclassified Lysinibacillus TaxID=2636778 RepID=UPI000D527F8D|nr:MULTISPECIES: sigma-70 family RNA polymerase sigma factor [unclassified Lysinibacillus]AWE07093.1 hypothetical protein DCE79_06590 [Lysinibacillus sp. 2017]TGN36988.1 sigma-70 family RNA polymerase sigma factor [Lysinibacillus sp. S2017]